MDDQIPPLAPVNEGGGVYVHGFPSGPKPYEEVLTFLRKGTELIKYGRHGNPKSHPFRLSNDDLELQWESKKGQIRRIPLQCITKWQKGQDTPVFKKHNRHPQAVHLSFSIHYIDEKRSPRTLDVICRTSTEFEMWFWGVQIIRYYPPHAWSAPTPLPQPSAQQYSAAVVPAGKREVQSQAASRAPAPLEIPSVRASLTDDRTPKPVPKAKPALSVMVGSRGSGLVHSVTTLRHDRREMGDLYVWGSLVTYEQDDWYEPKAAHMQRAAPRPELKPEAMREWQSSREPVLVQNAFSVDVVRVACAPRHAALITRKGELYTWGYGKDGNLGHGWCANLISPRLVTRMSGKGVHMVSCSEGATAAITADMRLYMWGNGSAGQLGNGFTFPCVEPAPVIFPGLPEYTQVHSVSCGPFHTAAITADGYLYTWGNGLFGKLGHGSHASEYRPRKVAALADKFVTCVSCGYWHTAAVAVPRTAAAVKELSQPFILHTPASTPATTDGPPTGGVVGLDGSVGRAGGPPAPSDMSSSGGDLQGMLADAKASGGVRGSFTVPEGSAPGGGGGGVASSSGLLQHGRSGLSSSVASMEQLRDAPERSSSASDSAGALYTWGGDFSWLEHSDPAKQKRDHHGGCLGTGDKEGRLLPTRVRGDLDKHGVVQVACGWSMTIALSRDGRVYQMGSTGATKSGEKGCAWEGALTPTRVDGNLFNMFVEEVTCGMHHVVVVASKVQANGHIADDQRRVRLLTWGRGTEGQLGVDSKADGTSGEGPLTSRMPPQVDYLLPQVVSAVDGKRVLHVAAGGNHTMAVVEHDPRVHRAPPAVTPAATPSNPYANGALVTPTGAGNGTTSNRVAPYMQQHAAVGTMPAREASTIAASAASAASSLLGMSSPFTIANALPSTAVAGLQTLQQMVGTVVPRSKLSTPASSTATRGSSRRHPGPSRQMVAIPAPHRSDILRSSELRRSAAQKAAQGGAVVGSAGAGPGHFSKSMSMHAKLQTEHSVGSSGMLSHRSSPAMVKGHDDADSRSLSPSSSMLYEVGSSQGDLLSAREHASTGAVTSPASGRERGDDGASGAGASRAHYGPSVAGPAAADEADGLAGLGDLSMAGLSTMEDMEPESAAYYRGRSLDMVPEQPEESPASPDLSLRHPHAHHASGGFTQYHTANGVAAATTTRGQEPYVDSPESVQEVLSLSAEGLPAEDHVALHPRVALLARGSGGGSPGPGGVESARSSASTIDTSYGTGSSGVSPPGQETPDDAVSSRSPRVGMPGGPYSMLHEAAAPPPPPLAYPAHLPQPGVTLLPGPPSSTTLASPAAGPSGRGREVSISMWAQQPAAQAVPPAAMYRGEASFRTFGPPADAAVTAGPDGAQQRHSNPGPLAAAGSRGSRGHSRHASHDSIDLGQGRDNRNVFDLAPPVGFMPGAASASGGHTPPRLSVNAMLPPVLAPPPAASDPATLALKQQNELLMQQVETLRQQVTLLAQAAGLGAAAAAAGGAAAAAGAGGGNHAFAQPVSHMAQSQPSTPSTAAAVHGAVPLGHGVLHPQQSPVGLAIALPGGDVGGGSAAPSPFSGPGTQLLPPPPLHLQHAVSMGHATAGPLASPSGHVPPSLGGVGGPQRASTFERQVHGAPAASPHADSAAPPPGPRHRRATSIDVSSLIATRDGIGPAKDYLAPAPPQPPLQPTTSAGHLSAGGSAGGHARDGPAMGHHTAPPALDALRKAHPGMSLAQAALAEADEEGLDEEEDEQDDHLPPGSTLEPSSRGGGSALEQTDASEQSSCSSSASAAADADAGGGSQGRRAALVDVHQMLLQQKHQHSGVSAGGAGRVGSGGGSLPGCSTDEAVMTGSQHSLAPTAEGTVHQYKPGVYLTIKPPPRAGLRPEVVKVRFSRRHFSHAEAQQWLAKNKAELCELFNVTATMGGGGGGGSSRGATPAGYPLSPAAAPSQTGTQQPAVTSHTRGASTDTQGSSGAANSYYFSVPSSSATHGYGAAGSGGSAVGHPPALAADGSLTRGPLVAWGPVAATSAATGSGGDPYAHWADVDPSVLAVPPPMPAGHPLPGMPPPAPRHHHSRSGSRNASGGAGSVASGQPLVWAAPRELGPGVHMQGMGTSSGSQYRHHSRTPSGGALSTHSNESNRLNQT